MFCRYAARRRAFRCQRRRRAGAGRDLAGGWALLGARPAYRRGQRHAARRHRTRRRARHSHARRHGCSPGAHGRGPAPRTRLTWSRHANGTPLMEHIRQSVRQPLRPPIYVLIVDDVQNNITALEASLARPDISVLAASSGPAALELLLKHEVALAILDVNMPGMDGFELAELMRGSPRTAHVPIIFLTATAQDTGRTFRGYEAGAVDFLYKPYDPRILQSKVDVFVQLEQQKRQLAAQLVTTRQMLEANEMLMAVLSHDLRTPLGAVLASAEYLMRTAADEQSVTVAARVKNSSLRMARMVDQLLN